MKGFEALQQPGNMRGADGNRFKNDPEPPKGRGRVLMRWPYGLHLGWNIPSFRMSYQAMLLKTRADSRDWRFLEVK